MFTVLWSSRAFKSVEFPILLTPCNSSSVPWRLHIISFQSVLSQVCAKRHYADNICRFRQASETWKDLNILRQLLQTKAERNSSWLEMAYTFLIMVIFSLKKWSTQSSTRTLRVYPLTYPSIHQIPNTSHLSMNILVVPLSLIYTHNMNQSEATNNLYCKNDTNHIMRDFSKSSIHGVEKLFRNKSFWKLSCLTEVLPLRQVRLCKCHKF